VVSEALMAGTPVICSDTCGSAGVVRASGYGDVFRSGDRDELMLLLKAIISAGHLSSAERDSLVGWAECLGGDAGAAYLLQILDHVEGRTRRPLPPWDVHATEPHDGAGHGH
jgi:glycosyltransferase involved in cell wall biosynthesis